MSPADNPATFHGRPPVAEVKASSDRKRWRFVISHEDPDLVGDVVVQAGLVPVSPRIPAQVDHSGQLRDQVGEWSDIRVEGNKTTATLTLLEAGLTRAADMVRAFLEAGVRMAASIGFVPDESAYELIRDAKNERVTGIKFLKAQLVEASIVVVPAQPLALNIAKGLGLSLRDLEPFEAVENVQRLPRVSARADLIARAAPAASRATSHRERGSTMTPTLAEKITSAKAAIVADEDQLAALSAKTAGLPAGEDPTEEDRVEADELTARIERGNVNLKFLETMERGLARRAVGAGEQRGAPAIVHANRKPTVDLFVRSALAAFESNVTHQSVESIVARRWPQSVELAEVSKLLTFNVKAAQAPAMTTVPGWAQELVRDTYAAFMDLLQPESVVPRMPLQREDFGGAQSIVIPARDANTTQNLAAAFRAEGAPIRVGAAKLTSQRLTQKSMGVIGAFTKELLARSTPSIEEAIRRWMLQDTALALDTAFLDATAGTAIRPAGMQAYVGAGDTAASTGNTAAQITADIRARLTAMSNAKLGRNPRWLMNSAHWWGVSMSLTPTGDRAFPEAANGQLAGIPVITSTTVPLGIVFLIDAAEVVFAGGAPTFEGSDVATLHMDDGAPNTNMVTGPTVLQISTGAPGAAVVATPVVSMFQTHSAAVKALWMIDWAVIRAHAVQTITGVAW